MPVLLWFLLCAVSAAPALAQRGPASAAPGQAPAPEFRQALVIGNSRYRPAPLPHAADRARAMGTALASCGFQVIRRTDCSRADLESAVRQLAGRLQRRGGVIGEDEDRGGKLRAIEFPRIKGGKPFDIDAPWFGELLAAIGQPRGARVAVQH